MDAPVRRPFIRSRSKFLTRAATDDASQLDRRSSAEQRISHLSSQTPMDESQSSPLSHKLMQKILNSDHTNNHPPNLRHRSSSESHRNRHGVRGETSLTMQMHKHSDARGGEGTSACPKAGSMPRPVGGTDKLGTFSGVFVPTVLNVLSILMFLRFGFILGQSGVVGIMGTSSVACYAQGATAETDDVVEIRHAYRCLYYQSRDHIVHLRDCYERDGTWWWRVLLDFSFIRARIWRIDWPCFLSWFCLQYRYECRWSSGLSQGKLWRKIWQLGSMVTSRLLDRLRMGNSHSYYLYWYLSGWQQHVCSMQ